MSSYKIEVKQNGDTKQVKLTGSLIINHIEKMVEELQELLTPQENVELTAEADNVDITFVQLVLAMKKSWAKSGMKLTVQCTIPDDLTALMEKAGIKKEVLNSK